MNQQQIEENNELLDVFMSNNQVTINIPFTYDKGEMGQYSERKLINTEDFKDEVYAEFDTGDLNPYDLVLERKEYHNSWDLLMPVIEKIDLILPDDNFVSITFNRCLIEYFEKGITFEGLGDTRIEATYKAVIEFIKWYNSQK